MNTKRTAALAGVALTAMAAATSAAAGAADNSLVWATDREVNVPFVWWDTTTEMAAMMHHVFDTLVYRNPETMAYEPLLARSWRWVDDTTLEFELREDVRFHDGSSFDADDVVASYTRLIDPATGVLNATLVNWMSGVEKFGQHAVRIRMKAPFPPAFEFLSGTRMGILPAEAWEGLPPSPKGGPDFTKMRPVGTGPYVMADFRPGEGMTLTRNPDYFDGAKGQPAIGTIVFRTIADQETRIAELMVGNIDWITDLPVDMAEQLGAMPGVAVTNGPDMRIAYLAIDRVGKTGEGPLNDVRVRRAIGHAIDREAIARSLVGPGSMVIDSACYPTQVGCTSDVTVYGYDPDRARALLAEAGYAGGFAVEFGAYRERPYAEAVIGYLREVGIDAQLNYLQFAGMRDRIANGNMGFAMRSWASSGLNDISAIASVLMAMEPDDLCSFPEAKALLGEGDRTIDAAQREAIYARALEMIAQEACFLPMFSYSKLYGHAEKLSFLPTADGFPLFYLARWED